MRLVWSADAWEDYLHWQDTNAAILGRINLLIREASRTPVVGMGKPEPLKGHLKGWWSRRITASHRLVYRVSGMADGQALEILQCRRHYA